MLQRGARSHPARTGAWQLRDGTHLHPALLHTLARRDVTPVWGPGRLPRPPHSSSSGAAAALGSFLASPTPDPSPGMSPASWAAAAAAAGQVSSSPAQGLAGSRSRQLGHSPRGRRHDVPWQGRTRGTAPRGHTWGGTRSGGPLPAPGTLQLCSARIHYLPVPRFHGLCHCHTVTHPAAARRPGLTAEPNARNLWRPSARPHRKEEAQQPRSCPREGPGAARNPLYFVPGGMRSSRETHGFGLGASQRLRTPRTPICSIGAKRCQGPPGALGSPERSPIPCSGIARGQLGSCFLRFNQGIRIFHGRRLLYAIPAAPTARHRCHCCGAFPFPQGQDIPLSPRARLCTDHGSLPCGSTWIPFPLPLTPLPALWGLQGTPAPASAHSPAWSSGKGGRMIPRKEWGEGGS